MSCLCMLTHKPKAMNGFTEVECSEQIKDIFEAENLRYST